MKRRVANENCHVKSCQDIKETAEAGRDKDENKNKRCQYRKTLRETKEDVETQRQLEQMLSLDVPPTPSSPGYHSCIWNG